MSPHLRLCSAFQPHPQRAPQMLHFYSSVSQKRPQSGCGVSLHKALWFSASFSPPPSSTTPPVIYRLPRRTSRGTPPTIYPVNTQPLAFCLFCTSKKNKTNPCKRLAKQHTRQAAHLLPSLGTSTLQSFHHNDFFLFVSLVCISFYPPLPVSPSVPLQ